MAMTNAERKEVKALLELAADLASHKARLDPDWPAWRKKEFWAEIDPHIKDYKDRARKLTGAYVIL